MYCDDIKSIFGLYVPEEIMASKFHPSAKFNIERNSLLHLQDDEERLDLAIKRNYIDLSLYLFKFADNHLHHLRTVLSTDNIIILEEFLNYLGDEAPRVSILIEWFSLNKYSRPNIASFLYKKAFKSTPTIVDLRDMVDFYMLANTQYSFYDIYNSRSYSIARHVLGLGNDSSLKQIKLALYSKMVETFTYNSLIFDFSDYMPEHINEVRDILLKCNTILSVSKYMKYEFLHESIKLLLKRDLVFDKDDIIFG